MSFGVSGVGDIISICLLTKDLVEALDSSRGAATEYQEINRELWSLERALLQVDLLSRTCNNTVELNALYETARQTAENCRQCMGVFLQKVRKYAPSLKDGGSGNLFRDASRKIQWQFMQSSDVSKFRAEIVAYSQSISMLLATASVNKMAINEEHLNARLSNSERNIVDEMSKQTGMVVEVRDRLKENNTLLSSLASTITDGVRLNWFRQLGAELKNMMHKIFRINFATYEAVIAIQAVLPSRLERSLYQDPFILEDAIGRITPVHTQFINCWEAFDAVLELRFQNVQGYKKVKKREYIFQEHATRREINRTQPWEGAFLPGKRIDMSLVFVKKTKEAEKTTFSSCPNCQTTSNQSSGSEVQCTACGMLYTRITEVVDVEPPPIPRVAISRPSPGNVQFGRSAFDGMQFGPKPPSKFPPISTKRKIEATELVEDDMAHFKRIRLVTSRDRVKFVPGPFHQVQLSGFDLPLDPTSKYKTEEERAWKSFKEKKTMFGCSHPDTVSALTTLVRTIRNIGKSAIAQSVLEETLATEEKKLLQEDPKSLRLLMSSLMAALVDQQKLEAAEALWTRGITLFQSELSEGDADQLIADFRLAHPFRKAPTSPSISEVDVGPERGLGNKLPQSWVSPSQGALNQWQDTCSQSSPTLLKQESFYEILSKWVQYKPQNEPSALNVRSTQNRTATQNNLLGQDKPSTQNEHSIETMPSSHKAFSPHDSYNANRSNELLQAKTTTYMYPESLMDYEYFEAMPSKTLRHHLGSAFMPKTRNASSSNDSVIRCGKNDSSNCPKCSMQFDNYDALEAHAEVWHPTWLIIKLVSVAIDSYSEYISSMVDWLWLVHNQQSKCEGFLSLKLGFVCCSPRVSSFNDLYSIAVCSSSNSNLSTDHTLPPPLEIWEQLRPVFSMKEKNIIVMPRFPYLEVLDPELQVKEDCQRTCELLYDTLESKWKCAYINGGVAEELF